MAESGGWSVQHGAETAPGGLVAERSNYGKIVLEHWLHDTLLPKLISGELRVQDAERFVREDDIAMTTTPEQIDLWRQSPSEHQRLEFKEAKTQFDNRRLYQYCVALANEGGGHLVLGVADKPPRPVVGTQAFKIRSRWRRSCFEALGFRVDIEEVAHPDGRVLVFHIPSRPRGTAYHLGGKYLMRSGEALVPMSEDQLRRIFAEGEPDWLEEHSKTGLDAQQVVELLDTQTFFELLKLPYPDRRRGRASTGWCASD